jgi:Flp pilus assembly protein TadG
MSAVDRLILQQRNRKAGQSLLEFALVVLFLVVVMIGIIDFARFFFTYGTLANAAREGARYGIIYPMNEDAGDRPDPDNIMYHVRSSLGWLGNAMETPYIEITFPDAGCRTVGCRVSVKVTAFFKTWTPLIPRFPIVAQAIMYIE